MTELYCPKRSCIHNSECARHWKGDISEKWGRDWFCTRNWVELEYDLCEPGLMDCKNFEEKKQDKT